MNGFWLLARPDCSLLSEGWRWPDPDGGGLPYDPAFHRPMGKRLGTRADPVGLGFRLGYLSRKNRLWKKDEVAQNSSSVAALARPQWGILEETVFDQSREVLIALDLSASMLADDVKPTRLARAKLLIGNLLDELQGERVGLAVFAGSSFLQVPLSSDYEVLRDILPGLDPSYLPQAGTDYAGMLRVANEAFGQSTAADRFLIVLSDGEAHDMGWKTALTELKNKKVKIITLGIGTAGGAVLPDPQGGVMKDGRGAAVLSRLEPATLEELAQETAGAYREASNWVDLAGLIKETVDQGRAGDFSKSREARQAERFQLFLGPALLFLLMSFALEMPSLPTRRRVAMGTTTGEEPLPAVLKKTTKLVPKKRAEVGA
ncbi:VWA domain-containing protein [bacterium]|nr:VWA domain-containing protein [bacterium]